uniref:Uncharacterized protein n=1 Tax=Arcella intermedia TaxID=1963864 RepID=A0A6B2LKR9_9EUKA|eukprot:TRINITY_DN5584_c0_g1_i1.p1 TRINITY_DN5584_c0_g1~~TRINITY_DN5584_c0_g1_i1.p1  ORF type:complete len:184 (-),score=42.74 TRINITY_DN5584_c0_g1_i1:89-640(-)
MFVIDWIWGVLNYLGLLQKKATIVMLGLDNAGKSTLLHKIKYAHLTSLPPTERALLEELVVGNVKFSAWDLGGHEIIRAAWREYYVQADVIVFVIDSSDTNRIEEAKEELHEIIHDENLTNRIILILGNKIDLVNSLSREQLIEMLDIQSFLNESPKAQIFSTSVITGTGIQQAFQWAASLIQ